MLTPTLQELEASIERLDVEQQEELVKRVAARLAGGQATEQAGERERAAAIAKFWATGERLATTSIPGAMSVVDEIGRSRR